MRKIAVCTMFLVFLFTTNFVVSQEWYKEKVEELKAQKIKITEQEKEALKKEVVRINERYDNGELSVEEANNLKEAEAMKSALNIEDRIEIIDNRIALLERNEGNLLNAEKDFTINDNEKGITVSWGDREPFTVFRKRHRIPRYDRRTYSDFVFAVGFNNAIIEGRSLDDSPYKIGGSRFAELGWAWRTRVFQNSNFMRLSYGASFQFNGLKPTDNRYFVYEDGQTELREFEYDLKKSKLRMDNLVFPVHFEFGPSKLRKTEKTIRYSLHNQFRVGLGGYGGFNLGTRQKLKYERNGENVKDKLKRGYNTSNLVYGLSAYAGFDGVLLYAKYDLNPMFKNADVEQRNISLGLRFDL